MFKEAWVKYKNARLKKRHELYRSNNPTTRFFAPIVSVIYGIFSIGGKILKWTVFIVLEILLLFLIIPLVAGLFKGPWYHSILAGIGAIFYIALALGLRYAFTYKKRKFY